VHSASRRFLGDRPGAGAIVAVAALILGPATAATAGELRAGAAAVDFEADDAMVIGGGILPARAKGQEGRLRAAAVVVEGPDGAKVCLVACDVLMIARDVLDRAARRIEERTGIPFDHILINATHTHHAPTTVTVHGYRRDEGFTAQVEDKIVAAAVAAAKAVTPVAFSFRLGEESSVGRNSRLLLVDGTIYWVGRFADAVRPTGPFDPDLPVLAFDRTDGAGVATLFNHSTHAIGTLGVGLRSPSFYGLAAQLVEGEVGGTVLFFSGAAGSTHNLDVPAGEATFRIAEAVREARKAARPRAVRRVSGVRKEVTVRVRRFDEEKEDAAVAAYCRKRAPRQADATIEVFRAMRKELAPQMGRERKTWVQAILIGDVALVGVPGEFFTVLGREIKRRSPYRETFVFGLANDYIGYVPDARAFDRGGYQVWTGLHSFVERGTGEAIVEEAVGLLERLRDGPAD
jgi:neutral ceramidase